MIQAEIVDFDEIDSIIGMFRPPPKVVEVPKYI